MPKALSESDIEAFRERLCDVAEELFVANGPNGVTMRQLAEALGVSSMTPYRYFKDKDAILAAVRTRAFNRFAEAMEAAEIKLRKKNWDRPEDPYVDFALKNQASYRMMFDTYQPTFRDHPELVAAMDRARGTMTSAWKGMAERGQFKGNIELAGHLHWSAMHGAVMLELAGFLRKPLDARAIVTPTLDALSRHLGLKE